MTDLTYATWRKSSYSNGANGACVEVARTRRPAVGVRDTKNRDGGVLVFEESAWSSFVTELKCGRFDRG